jgi:hypothetical protein
MIAALSCFIAGHASYETSRTSYPGLFRQPFLTGDPTRELFGIRRSDSYPLDHWGTDLEAAVFGGASLNSDAIARYFCPFDKRVLIIAEDEAPNAQFRDVAASHLNIETNDHTFFSRVTFKPQQAVTGVGLLYRQRLASGHHANMPDHHESARWWLEISAPLLHVSTTMGMAEELINSGGGAVDAIGLDNAPRVGTATAAFAQPQMNYGRIYAGTTHSRTGIGDVEVKISYNTLDYGAYYVESAAGLVLPAGGKPSNHCVFEPVLGNGGFVGATWTSTIGLNLVDAGHHHLESRIISYSQYLFSAMQVRSFDLKDKSWSRYMESYASPAAALAAAEEADARSGSFGANLYTKKMRVSPRFNTSLTNYFVYRYKCLAVEAGYGIFAKQSEVVDFEWRDDSAALKHVTGEGNTTFARTIKDNFAEVIQPATNYAYITERMINKHSAEQGSMIRSTVFGGIGYQSTAAHGTMVGLGFSCDFAAGNTSLERWLVFLRCGGAF